jgi:hypothetical protein
MPGQLVRTKSATITTAVPSTTGAYSSGQIVGGLLSILRASQDAQSGVVLSLAILDAANQSLTLDVFFFQGPLAGSFGDKTAFAPSTADLQLCCGFVHVATTDYAGGTGNSVGCPASKPLTFQLPAKSANALSPNDPGAYTLYAVIVARGAPTYGAGGMSLVTGILQD